MFIGRGEPDLIGTGEMAMATAASRAMCGMFLACAIGGSDIARHLPALEGMFKLVAPPARHAASAKDCATMSPMFIDEPVQFGVLMLRPSDCGAAA